MQQQAVQELEKSDRTQHCAVLKDLHSGETANGGGAHPAANVAIGSSPQPVRAPGGTRPNTSEQTR